MRLPGARRRDRAGLPATIAACALLIAAALAATVTRAAPAAAAACGSAHASGVTVVVDFRHFRHGRVRVRCDAQRPHTGLAALRKAGFSYTFVPRQPGFVCRIGGKPNPCNGAPTAAYWSYWHARPHGRWRYSTLGAGSYHPRAGWVEGWAFGNGQPPAISPP